MTTNKIFSDNIEKCPLCQSTSISYKYTIKSFRSDFQIDQCRECGFIFTNPPFSDNTIESFYSKNYFNGNAEYFYIDEREIKRYSAYVWDKRVDKLHSYNSEGNFLDIGCSFGGFLESADRYYSPYGIEISTYAAEFSRKKFGESIHTGTIENHSFKDNFFSIITMIEVIEHLKNPDNTVKRCYEMLKDNGILMIQTANMDGLQAKMQKEDYAYFMPGHLSYFTKNNLTLLLKKNGFRKIKVFQPVEFGLLPKLKKSRGSFKSFFDYRKWIRISFYHFLSKLHFKNFSTTSSMVIYAFK